MVVALSLIKRECVWERGDWYKGRSCVVVHTLIKSTRPPLPLAVALTTEIYFSSWSRRWPRPVHVDVWSLISHKNEWFLEFASGKQLSPSTLRKCLRTEGVSASSTLYLRWRKCCSAYPRWSCNQDSQALSGTVQAADTKKHSDWVLFSQHILIL